MKKVAKKVMNMKTRWALVAVAVAFLVVAGEARPDALGVKLKVEPFPENILDVTGSTVEPTAGDQAFAVINAGSFTQPAEGKFSFGQPFSPRLGDSTVVDAIVDAAYTRYRPDQVEFSEFVGARFLGDVEILRWGNVDDGTQPGPDTALLDDQYDEGDLEEAEALYRQALAGDPFSEDALVGILAARTARVLKRNLVADYYRKLALVERIENADGRQPGAILQEELDRLVDVSNEMRESVKLILELLCEEGVRSPGHLLRNLANQYELPPGDRIYTATERVAAAQALQLIFASTKRFAEAELEIGRKTLLKDFFDRSMQTATSERLADAHAYVGEVLRFTSPYTASGLLVLADVGEVADLHEQLSRLERGIRQGYNAFGFVPDFVPFVNGTADVNNLSTVNILKDLALNRVSEASTAELAADLALDESVQAPTQLKANLDELADSYNQRLETIAGTVTYANGDIGPDIFTVSVPERLPDGAFADLAAGPNSQAALTARAIERARLEDEIGVTFGARGLIFQQYQQIFAAEQRVLLAVKAVEDKAQEILDLNDLIAFITETDRATASLVRTTGEAISTLTRQKGVLQKEAAYAQAEVNKRSDLFGAVYETWKEDPIAAALGAANPTVLLAEAGLGVDVLTLDEALDTYGLLPGKSTRSAALIAGFGLGAADTIFRNNAIGQTAAIQGQLAEGLASIDAEIVRLQANQQAEIILANSRKEVERLKVQLASLIRDEATLRIQVRTAQIDVLREMQALFNLLEEFNSLYQKQARAIVNASNEGNWGWNDADVRDVVRAQVVRAEKAFERAQVWCYVLLRAADYYLMLKPQGIDGNDPSALRPNADILARYSKLYQARNAGELTTLINDIDVVVATGGLTFGGSVGSCDSIDSRYSLKYDFLIPTAVEFTEAGDFDGFTDGEQPDTITEFTYVDPVSGQTVEGRVAYQAAFNAWLADSISGETPNRRLTLVFSTDPFPRPLTAQSGDFGDLLFDNPFGLNLIGAKVTGFDACDGSNEFGGIKVNVTGTLSSSTPIRVWLTQAGNSLLQFAQWDTLSADGRVELEPWKWLATFSYYQQLSPTWLLTDIDPQVQSEPEFIGDDITFITSESTSNFFAKVNGQSTQGNTTTDAFTDRAVCNDKWIIEVRENISGDFFRQLDNQLGAPVAASGRAPIEDFQLEISWGFLDR